MRRWRAARVVAGALLAAAVVTGAGPTGAQIPRAPSTAPLATPAPGATAQPGTELTISLLTFGQGDEVWELFGHNAIWVHDARRGTDVAYDWGRFSFDQPNFIGRFLTGDTKYAMGSDNALDMAAFYGQIDRQTWVQELAMTPAQRVALRDFLEWNDREENRYYRYDYYRDNCSTRVRDALDRALGGAIARAVAGRTTPYSYRWHTQRLVQTDLPVYTGVTLALGHPADRPLTAWEEAFLPVKLHDRLRDVRVPDESGALVPLVRSERVLHAARRGPEPAAPPRWTPVYLLVGLAVAALVAWLAVASTRPARPARAARAALAVVGGLWGLVGGVLGTAVFLAWTVTRHAYMYRNESLLQVNPLVLGLVLLLPLAAFGRATRGARRLTTSLAALSVLGLLIKSLPAFRQHNLEIVAFALPVNVAFAWAAARLAARPRVATA